MDVVLQYIRIITLNCWGIPFVSKNKQERMLAIAKYLAQGEYDLVSLQEIWDKSDYEMITNTVRNVLPYSHYFHSGVLGSGVCVLSKWPIEQVFFHQYSLNGYAHMIHHADWFGGKGIGLCKIKHNDMTINFYSAHLHAEYCSDDIYLAHRVIQAYDTAEFIRLTSSSADMIVLAGDLNTQPTDLAYKIITGMGNLHDSCLKGLSEKEKKAKGTNEGAWNSYTDPAVTKEFPQGKRIDYILYNSQHNYQIQVANYDMPISVHVPGFEFSYSDHDAVSAKLQVSRAIDRTNNGMNVSECLSLMELSISICNDAMNTLANNKYKYSLLAFTIIIMLSITLPWFDGSTIIGIFKLFLLLFFFYLIFMATIWNRIEYNGVLSAYTSMNNFITFHKTVDNVQ